MGEVVNLRLAKKKKARADKEAAAAANRTAFGRSKAEKDRAAAEAGIDARRLDGHRRADAPEER
jgi:hypothetical protein